MPAFPRRVIGPDGTEYDDYYEAAEFAGVIPSTIRRWCRLGRYGWRYGERHDYRLRERRPNKKSHVDWTQAEVDSMLTTTPEQAYEGFAGYD